MGKINLKTRQQRIGYMDNKEYFLTSPEQYSRIEADQIIEYSSVNSGIPKAQMASAFYALNQQVEQFLLNGHGIELLNLGCLYLSVSAKATETEDEAGAKAVKRICVKFRQSKKLRDLINSNVQLVSALTKKSGDDSDDEDGDDTSSTDTTTTGSASGGSGSGSDSSTGSSTSGSSTGGSTSGSSTGGNTSSSEEGQEGDYRLAIFKYGSGTMTVTDDSEQVINNNDQVHSGSNVNISVVPVEGKVPTAKINGSTTITLTENDGTYTGSFQMPTKGTVLEINSDPSGEEGRED